MIMNNQLPIRALALGMMAYSLLSHHFAQAQTQLKSASSYQLTAAQKAKLTQLPIPIVAPTYLPEGFRLVSASGEKGQYANGDDDSGYTLFYLGQNNTCVSVASSKDGPRGKWQQVVDTRFGAVKVFTQTYENKYSIYSFIPVKGNPSLLSGGSLPNPDANGNFKPCQALSMAEYVKVLRSLQVIK